MSMNRQLLSIVVALLSYGTVRCYSQCNIPEITEYPAPYNKVVCEANIASQHGDYAKALDLLLSASKTQLLEAPNVLLYNRIAATYIQLGQYQNADLYLRYDSIALLWRMGIIRCNAIGNDNTAVLLKEGHLLNGEDASFMASVLCGDAFSDLFDFNNEDIESYYPLAKAIIRHHKTQVQLQHMKSKIVGGKK
jgi:hypothetical protein